MITAQQLLERQLTPQQKVVFWQTLQELQTNAIQTALKRLASKELDENGQDAFFNQISENNGIALGIAFITAKKS